MNLAIPYKAIAHISDLNNKGSMQKYDIEQVCDSMQAAILWGCSLNESAKQDQGVTIDAIEFNPIG